MHNVVKRESERVVYAVSLTRGQMDIFKGALINIFYNINESKTKMKGVAHNDKPRELLSDYRTFLASFSSLFVSSDPQTLSLSISFPAAAPAVFRKKQIKPTIPTTAPNSRHTSGAFSS